MSVTEGEKQERKVKFYSVDVGPAVIGLEMVAFVKRKEVELKVVDAKMFRLSLEKTKINRSPSVGQLRFEDRDEAEMVGHVQRRLS